MNGALYPVHSPMSILPRPSPSRRTLLPPFPKKQPFPKFPLFRICCESDDTPRRKAKPNRSMSTNPPPKRSKKPSYGTSRRSLIKKTFSQEQVDFKTPISTDPVVGIIGGGMSGLVCALYLEKRGIKSTVFDTGIHGLGGRMGTRMIDPQPLVFDHAAQFFTVTEPKFAELVDVWSEKGLVREWCGVIGELEAGGYFVPFPSSPPRYIGVNGMRPLAESILSETSMVNVVRPCWVSTLEPYNGMWYLSEKGKSCGCFDAIVIAHNGKCANRLLGTSGLPLIARQMKERWQNFQHGAAYFEVLGVPTPKVQFTAVGSMCEASKFAKRSLGLN